MQSLLAIVRSLKVRRHATRNLVGYGTYHREANLFATPSIQAVQDARGGGGICAVRQQFGLANANSPLGSGGAAFAVQAPGAPRSSSAVTPADTANPVREV